MRDMHKCRVRKEYKSLTHVYTDNYSNYIWMNWLFRNQFIAFFFPQKTAEGWWKYSHYSPWQKKAEGRKLSLGIAIHKISFVTNSHFLFGALSYMIGYNEKYAAFYYIKVLFLREVLLYSFICHELWDVDALFIEV